MAGEKFTPDYVKMSLADAQGAAKAAKNMAHRRFKRFKGDVQEVIEGGRYNEDDYKTVKDRKKTLRRILTGMKISSPIWMESMQQSPQSLL